MGDPSQAFVLSGGGVFGAYQVGVMKALMEGRSPSTGYRPLIPGVLTGTSTGGYNAAFLTAQCPKQGTRAIQSLEAIWLQRISGRRSGDANGVYRFRANPFVFLRPREFAEAPVFFTLRFAWDTFVVSREYLQRTRAVLRYPGTTPEDRLIDLIDILPLISIQPLIKTIRTTIDFEAIQASSIALQILVTDWENGGIVHFDKRSMSPDLGLQILRASTAVPGMFPYARLGTHTYVDGSLLANLPMVPAIRAGATTLHAIYPTRSTWNTLGLEEPGLVTALLRNQGITWANAARKEVDRAQAINELIQRIHRLQRQAASDPWQYPNSESELQALEEALQGFLRSPNDPLRTITIHNYCLDSVEDPNPLGPLDFSSDRVKYLIARGYSNTLQHDCRAAGCILPESDTWRSASPELASPELSTTEALA